MKIQSGITKKIVILKYFKMHIIACQVILNINQLKKMLGRDKILELWLKIFDFG